MAIVSSWEQTGIVFVTKGGSFAWSQLVGGAAGKIGGRWEILLGNTVACTQSHSCHSNISQNNFEQSLLVAMWPVSHALLKRKLWVLGSKKENRIGPLRFKHELPDFGSKIRNRSFVEATNCNKTVLHQRLPSWSSFYWLAIKHGAATTECFYSFNYSKVLLGVSIWLILVRF